MRIRRLIVFLALVSLILACNYPTYVNRQAPPSIPEIQAQPPVQVVLPTQILPATQIVLPTLPLPTSIPSNTPLPTDTPTITPTSTPTIPIAWAKDVAVNCRFGYGTEWAIMGALMPGQTSEIYGKNAANTWWNIKDPTSPGDSCWVAMSVTNAAGNLTLVPVLSQPTASVTKVTVAADVSFSACAGPNPVGFSGKITTNGPVKVNYRWEVGGDKENIASEETIKFTEAGTKEISAPVYKVDCGDYFVILHVLIPNNISAKKNFGVP